MNGLGVDLIFLYQIPYLINTIMTGDKYDLGTCLSNLLCFDLTALEAMLPHFSAHGHGPAASGAAEIVIALIFHGTEIFRHHLGQGPVFNRQTAVSNNIAGVLHGCGFFNLMFEFYSTVSDIIVKQFNRVDDFLFGSVTQPGGRFVPKRAIGVASFSDGDLFHPQLLGPGKGILNNHFGCF